MKEKIFAIGLSENRFWGTFLVPFVLNESSSKKFYSIDHIVFPDEKDENYLLLTHTEKEIVKIIDEYNDQELFKLFSKERTLKDFQEKVTKDKIQNFIRPYIEKRIFRVLEILRNTRINVFIRDKSRPNIYAEDFLKVHSENAVPVFHFRREDEGSMYSMVLQYKNNVVNIKDSHSEIICEDPAVIRLNKSILFVDKIEAKKIRPFFTKDHIHIPRKTEETYFKKFLINLVRNHKVNAEGFKISHIEPSIKTLFNIEKGIANNAIIVLKFTYQKHTILANSSFRIFVDLHKGKGSYRYDKYSRNEAYENAAHVFLNDIGLISYDQVNYEIKGNRKKDFREQLYELLVRINDHARDIEESGYEICMRGGNEKYYLGERKLIFEPELNIDWFEIRSVLQLGDFVISFSQLRRNILQNDREFKLPDGSIFIIPSEWFARFKEMFEFGKIENDQINIHKQHFFILEKAEKGVADKYIEKLEVLNKREDLPAVNVPDGLTTELRSYQMEGFTWLWYLQRNKLGGCLADDMGLGKTIQAITLLQKNSEIPLTVENEELQPQNGSQLNLFSEKQEKLRTSLIVVPASLIHNWMNEIKRFAPGLKIYSYFGINRDYKPLQKNQIDIVISSYHTVRQDIEILSNIEFFYIILDESQMIKNPSSKLYNALKMLNSEFKLVLSGTPIENSLTDLWAQMNFVNPGLLGNRSFFRREYVHPIERKNDTEREEKLKKLINPFVLRRTKDEVAKELPDVFDQVIYCSMTEEQRKIYDEEKSSVRNAIFDQIESEGIKKSSMIVLQGLTRLRQISNHPGLVDENYMNGSGKYDEIVRSIESVVSEGHNVLVFSSFVKHLEIFEERLKKEHYTFAKLTGASTKREDIVKEFQQNPDCRIFLISLKAGGVGLNLTAADYVFILDPWWNPKSEEQAINRAHRIGQDKNVFVYRFISENSIEEKIQKLQQRKARLADAFIHSNNPLKDIDKEELNELFA